MAEFSDWTTVIDQQTEKNNLRNSPEGQLAFQTGQANLERIQGEVKGQQLDFQAKQLQQKAMQEHLARLSQGAKQSEAKEEQPTREGAEVSQLEQDIAKDRETADFYDMYAPDKAAALRSKISSDTARLDKLRNAPLDRAEKQNTLVKGWVDRLDKLAGAALSTRGGVANFITQRDAIKKEMQKANIQADPEMDAILNLPPTPENLKFLQMSGATVKEQLGKNSTAVAGVKVGQLDAKTGLLTKDGAAQSSAQRRADDAIVKSREMDNGEEGKDPINVAKMWGPGWDKLSADQKELLTNRVTKAYNEAKGSVNRTVSPEDLKKVAVGIGKEELGKFQSATDRARTALMTPEMLRDREAGVTRGRPAEKDQTAVDVAKGNVKLTPFEEKNDMPAGGEAKALDFAVKKQQALSAVAKGDDKPRLGGQDYLQMAMQIRNGEKETDVIGGLTESDKAGTKAVLNELERTMGPRSQYATGTIERNKAESLTRAGTETLRSARQAIAQGTGATSGVFSDLSIGKNPVTAMVKLAGTTLTDSDAQMYDNIAGYMGTEIATAANNGMKPPQAMINKYSELFKSPSGTPADVATFKLINGIDFVRNAISSGTPANRKDELNRRAVLKELNKFPDPTELLEKMKASGHPLKTADDTRRKLESMFNSGQTEDKGMSFGSEAEAEKAGIKPGTRVIINGVSGTWQ